MRSRLAARRRGLQRPTLSLWTCFRAPQRSSRWIGPIRNSMSESWSVRHVWTLPRVYSKLPCGLGRVTFPRSCPHRFDLRWSRFTLSIHSPSSLCFKWGWETPHALLGQGIEAVCGSLQGLEKILPVIGLFWCWPPRACHVEAEDFSLGERCHFAGLWGAEPPFTFSLRAHSTRGVASSQALFRVVPLEDICVAAGWSSPHTFVKFYNLDVDTAPGSQILSVWTDRMLLVHYWTR